MRRVFYPTTHHNKRIDGGKLVVSFVHFLSFKNQKNMIHDTMESLSYS